MRRKHGIRTEHSEHECQCRWPSGLPNALALICCDMQLHVYVQNSFDADRQRQAGTHGLAARLVYVFRGVSERERRGRKDTGQTVASVACGVLKLNFEKGDACSRGSCLICLLCLVSENVNKHAQQIRANAIGKLEGQRHWLVAKVWEFLPR